MRFSVSSVVGSRHCKLLYFLFGICLISNNGLVILQKLVKQITCSTLYLHWRAYVDLLREGRKNKQRENQNATFLLMTSSEILIFTVGGSSSSTWFDFISCEIGHVNITECQRFQNSTLLGLIRYDFCLYYYCFFSLLSIFLSLLLLLIRPVIIFFKSTKVCYTEPQKI